MGLGWHPHRHWPITLWMAMLLQLLLAVPLYWQHCRGDAKLQMVSMPLFAAMPWLLSTHHDELADMMRLQCSLCTGFCKAYGHRWHWVQTDNIFNRSDQHQVQSRELVFDAQWVLLWCVLVESQRYASHLELWRLALLSCPVLSALLTQHWNLLPMLL